MIKCLATALLIEALLRVWSLPRVCELLGVAFKPDVFEREPKGASVAPAVRRVASAVDELYRRLPLPDTCLRRALLAGRLLSEHRPTLVLGVRTAPHFEAHAWLELGDGVLDWSNRYAEFKRL